MGSSVAGAGDVNGHGYSDVIVGAFNCNNGDTLEGKRNNLNLYKVDLTTPISRSNFPLTSNEKQLNKLGIYGRAEADSAKCRGRSERIPIASRSRPAPTLSRRHTFFGSSAFRKVIAK